MVREPAWNALRTELRFSELCIHYCAHFVNSSGGILRGNKGRTDRWHGRSDFVRRRTRFSGLWPNVGLRQDPSQLGAAGGLSSIGSRSGRSRLREARDGGQRKISRARAAVHRQARHRDGCAGQASRQGHPMRACRKQAERAIRIPGGRGPGADMSQGSLVPDGLGEGPGGPFARRGWFWYTSRFAS